MKVYAKRSILSVYLEVGIDGKIEKLGLKIKNLRGPEKKYDSSKKCVAEQIQGAVETCPTYNFNFSVSRTAT